MLIKSRKVGFLGSGQGESPCPEDPAWALRILFQYSCAGASLNLSQTLSVSSPAKWGQVRPGLACGASGPGLSWT